MNTLKFNAFIFSLFQLISLNGFAQQVNIPRISTMPDFPQPYELRNWKAVAHGYDSLVFNADLAGQYLPLIFYRNHSVNYPQSPGFGLHTAVGTNAPTSGEAINVIAAVVGASLTGIDKSDQFGENWVSMIRQYFNRRPEENIYLNHPQTSSGHDWWYETMPNIFFMQLKDLYPEEQVFREQLPVMADQWLRAVRAMGASDAPWTVPYMNYRAWNMSQMQPLDQGVKQPEAAGAIAWILYNSYVSTANRQYLRGAEWAMEFLDQWNTNPSYELQLPYGIYTAARMNAEIGTSYDVEKMVNWAFDRGSLRGWGAISGNWGGYDVHGLIGEANDSGNDYAFMMNGYQQAAALVPMIRYDHRFAHAIGKWVLNMANASRLFYPDALPGTKQDNYTWSQTYDPEAFIGYEALREIKHGQSPYATGDAMEGGWAQTNLMLYGSSHVGYLAALVRETPVEGLLQLDLLKTDFYHQPAYATFLYYNPFDVAHTVAIALPQGSFKIYDVISKNILHQNQSGEVSITVPAGGVVMPVLVPQTEVISIKGRRTFAGNIIIDFNNGQPIGASAPRIKSLAAADSLVPRGMSTALYCTAVANSSLTYVWYMHGESITGDSHAVFNASEETGIYQVGCKVISEQGLTDSLSINIHIVEKIPYEPQIISLTATPRKIRPGESLELLAEASDFYDEVLFYAWQANAGTLKGEGERVSYTAPSEPGDYTITVSVSNPDGLSADKGVRVMVRNFPEQGQGNLIANYPLASNANDISGNELHATIGGGVVWTHNMNNQAVSAAGFNGTTANILMPDSEIFNFRDNLSITIFLKVDNLTEHEQHPISHGSWEQRFKISFGNQRYRFTLNTTSGIQDLDTESIIEPGHWHHLAVIYTGEDMEIWLDGKLDAFSAHTGMINTSTLNMVLGQNIPGNNNYNFNGAMALVKIYDFALSSSQINSDLSLNIENHPIQNTSNRLYIFPNPVASNKIRAETGILNQEPVMYTLYDLFGRIIIQNNAAQPEDGGVNINLPDDLTAGIYILKVVVGEKVFTGRFVKQSGF